MNLSCLFYKHSSAFSRLLMLSEISRPTATATSVTAAADGRIALRQLVADK